ncbi:MAG: SMC family ATPase, partial [Parasporobacterium sp.]|nr:SMC family ATPase [Parasporobacterium sp.]
LQAAIRRREAIYEKLADLQKEYDTGYKQAADDVAFAKTLRGDASVGIQRYVLAVMFQSVLDEANRMLQNVHEGRYRLVRVDDKGKGNKRGLELKVYDALSAVDEPRNVSLLSGGEKFLVSLALAIGMSAVAQHGGTKIDAMFIDEGFGTLDENSIEDAMSVLGSIRDDNGIVGIISHVQLLRDAIGNKLEVVKTGQGSHIRYV